MSALAFDLPRALEANEPPELRGSGRDDVRLLVSREKSVEHAHFLDLPKYVAPGDVLVVNRSATIPAALVAERSTGEKFKLHLSTRLPGELHVVEPRKTTVSHGEVARLPAGGRVTFLWPYRGSKRLWISALELPLPLLNYLRIFGGPISYDYIPKPYPLEVYQTIFANEPGSSEMPSAGRPFTDEIVAAIQRQGATIASILLHTGVASLETGEPPYDEWYEVGPETVAAVREAKRVIAVGTTVVRALESSVGSNGEFVASRGWTDLMIESPDQVRIVDGLLTGFHEPRATHLSMLQAFLGPSDLERAYAAALENGYLWHEFGDLHLIV